MRRIRSFCVRGTRVWPEPERKVFLYLLKYHPGYILVYFLILALAGVYLLCP